MRLIAAAVASFLALASASAAEPVARRAQGRRSGAAALQAHVRRPCTEAEHSRDLPPRPLSPGLQRKSQPQALSGQVFVNCCEGRILHLPSALFANVMGLFQLLRGRVQDGSERPELKRVQC